MTTENKTTARKMMENKTTANKMIARKTMENKTTERKMMANKRLDNREISHNNHLHKKIHQLIQETNHNNQHHHTQLEINMVELIREQVQHLHLHNQVI